MMGLLRRRRDPLDEPIRPVLLPDGWSPPTHDSPHARLARAACPRQGFCGRCGFPWALVKGHVTDFGEGRGCFPLCTGCWTLLGHPEARITYYGNMLDAWEYQTPWHDYSEERRAIGQAVAAGR